MDIKQKSRSGAPQRRSRQDAPARTGRKPEPAANRGGKPQSVLQGKRRNSAPARQSAERPRSQSPTRQVPSERRVATSSAGRVTPNMANQAPYAPVDLKEEVFRPEKLQSAMPQDPAAAKRSQMRKRSAIRSRERKKQLEKAKKRPAVVYTQPKPLNLNQMLLRLAVVLAAVLAIVAGLSVFFRVEKVVVYGSNAYSAWDIQEASGIEKGEKLLSLKNTRASGKIIANLPYVEDVRIGIKLPDTVNIYVTEYDVVYSMQDQDNEWWLITSGGKVVEPVETGELGNYTRVEGVQLSNPMVGEIGKAVEQLIPEATGAEGETTETMPVVVTGAKRLEAAFQILQALEKNDIVGAIATIDVSSLANIEMWYGQRYQVKVGDVSDLNKKMDYMKKAVAQRSDYDMGILDVSFTTWPDQVGYTPVE